MWKKLLLNQKHAYLLMLDCNCFTGSFGLNSCLIALCSSPGFNAEEKTGKFQDVAWATCPFSSSCLIHSSSPLLDTSSGGVI